MGFSGLKIVMCAIISYNNTTRYEDDASSLKLVLCYSLIVASSAKQIKYCIEYMIACVVLNYSALSSHPTATPQRRLSAPSMSSQLKMRVVLMCPLAASTVNYTHLMHNNSAPMELGRRHTVSMSLPLYQDDVQPDGGFGERC